MLNLFQHKGRGFEILTGRQNDEGGDEQHVFLWDYDATCPLDSYRAIIYVHIVESR
jgi:hypothetical protein